MKAMIFAAGLGTRLQPYTLDKPKALVEVNGVTLLELAIRKLAEHGFNDIIVNVHVFGDQIIDFIGSRTFDAKITISDERSLLLDTGGGLAHALPFFDDGQPFLVYNVDIITTADLGAFYKKHMEERPLVSLMVRERNTSRYLLFDEKMELAGWSNNTSGEEIWVNEPKSEAKPYAFSGIHVVEPRIAKYVTDFEKPFPIIPFYLESARQERMKGMLDVDSVWFDVGKVAQLKEAEAFLGSVSS